MSDDLTKKLEDLISQYADSVAADMGVQYGYIEKNEQVFTDSQAVDKIKQAFIDAGWMHIPPAQTKVGKPFDIKKATDDTGVVAIKSEPVMTGQEWYDRFEKEYRQTQGYTEHANLNNSAILQVAKKAAGIDS